MDEAFHKLVMMAAQSHSKRSLSIQLLLLLTSLDRQMQSMQAAIRQSCMAAQK